MSEIVLRAARPDEAGALSELIMRSKAVWGYDTGFLDAVRDQLRIRPDEIAARRVVVAELDGLVAGVATLDGSPSSGEIGLLFVAPDRLRRGIGKALYTYVLGEAGRLGFARLRIAADVHAVPFYRAMGAQPERLADESAGTGAEAADLGVAPEAGLVGMVAYPVAPEPSWTAAWNGGRRPVMVGNVAEFNGQFGRVGAGPDHYSCLATFCGPRPSAVVLPLAVDDWWREHVAGVLGWDDLVVTRAGDVAGGEDVRPWGWTPTYVRERGDLLRTVRRFESKRHANALFRELAGDHPGIVVPAQRTLRSVRALERELADGGRVVLKREYGVGGSGTLVATRETPGLRQWARGRTLVEEYVDGDPAWRDVTFDAVVDPAGWVHPVGAGLMQVDGTAYGGVTVGPDVVPEELARTAYAFGTSVGRALSAYGYRGWFDVDFIATRQGRLAPAEINLRLTGPAVAFHLRTTLDRRHGGRHVVRTLDCLPLGARLPAPALRDHAADLARTARTFGVTLLVTIPTAAFDPAPYIGVALAARTAAQVNAAETEIRQRNADLGAIFT